MSVLQKIEIMIRKLIFVVVTSLAIGIGYHQYFDGNLIIFGQSCHRRFPQPFKYMATKTPYLSHGLDKEAAKGDPYQTYHGGSCEPIMAWHLVRHGTRNPGKKVIKAMLRALPRLKEQILEAHQNGQGSLCEQELEEIQAWDPTTLPRGEPEDAVQEKILVPQGEIELQGISRRFKQMFPNLYAAKYHNDTYKFHYTKTQRAEASAKFFTKGLFEDESLGEIYFPIAVQADPVLRFYKDCKKWKKEVDKNPAAYAERVKFETSPIFKQMISKLQLRLGLEKSPSLEDVEIMYLACSFESAWHPDNPSPWCNVFNEFDFQILEYRQDVEYYWVDGYGYQLTYQLACPTIEDVVKKLSSKVSDPKSPSVVAYFTHSGTLLKVIARLGLFNDSIPLLGDNFDHHRSSRKWRTTFIDPFATNIAFILYKCSQDHKVGLMFKERPLAQPLCEGKFLCPLDELTAAVKPFIENCDLQGFCKI